MLYAWIVGFKISFRSPNDETINFMLLEELSYDAIFSFGKCFLCMILHLYFSLWQYLWIRFFYFCTSFILIMTNSVTTFLFFGLHLFKNISRIFLYSWRRKKKVLFLLMLHCLFNRLPNFPLSSPLLHKVNL